MSGDPCEVCGEWTHPGQHHECDAEYLLPLVRADVERWRSAYLESQALRYGETERLEAAEHKLTQIRAILENYSNDEFLGADRALGEIHGLVTP